MRHKRNEDWIGLSWTNFLLECTLEERSSDEWEDERSMDVIQQNLVLDNIVIGTCSLSGYISSYLAAKYYFLNQITMLNVDINCKFDSKAFEQMMISIYSYHKYIRLLVVFYHGRNIIFDIVGICILLQNFNGSWASLDYNVISSKPILIYMQAQKDVLHFIFLHAISKRDNVFNIVQCYCILRIFLLKNSIYLTAQLFK